MTKTTIQSLAGMRDILPSDQAYFKKIRKSIENTANYYGFQRIDVPILEHIEVFSKGAGSASDIVEKEMYSFRTKGGDIVALRPELTPGIARAYIQHGMHALSQPVKLWSIGPCFRHDRPQAGRYRQFLQASIEAIGDKSPSIDGQVIQMSYDILRDLKIKNISIEVNSIGDSECEPYFRKIIANYFKPKKSSLCHNCQRRLKEKPLRVLDCKEEMCRQIRSGAPQIIDHLCENCHKHFKDVLEFLDELELPYTLNPYLVRGLDYYTKTVFEISEKGEEGASLGALASGGRYDKLIKVLGGRDTPAFGAGIGAERIAALMKLREIKIDKKEDSPEVFLAQLGQTAKRKSMKLFEEFKAAKIPLAESFSKDSLRSQLNMADKMNVKWVLIFGQKEVMENFITLRDMETGSQREIPLNKVVAEIKKLVKK